MIDSIFFCFFKDSCFLVELSLVLFYNSTQIMLLNCLVTSWRIMREWTLENITTQLLNFLRKIKYKVIDYHTSFIVLK